jgi:cytochrome c oxidase subunit 5b
MNFVIYGMLLRTIRRFCLQNQEFKQPKQFKQLFKQLASYSTHNNPPPADEESVGPGTKDPALIASSYEQAAGLERVELLGKLAGRSAFLMDPLVVDHFGTLKDPIHVDSVIGRRLVGCTGFPKGSHEPLWFWVDEKEPMRCNDCGQAFRINKLH